MFTKMSKWVVIVGAACGAVVSLVTGIALIVICAKIYLGAAGVFLGLMSMFGGFLMTGLGVAIYGVLAEISYKLSENRDAVRKLNHEAPDATEMNLLTGKRYDPNTCPIPGVHKPAPAVYNAGMYNPNMPNMQQPMGYPNAPMQQPMQAQPMPQPAPMPQQAQPVPPMQQMPQPAPQPVPQPAPEQPKKWFCTQCGTPNEPTAEICANCGKPKLH